MHHFRNGQSTHDILRLIVVATLKSPLRAVWIVGLLILKYFISKHTWNVSSVCPSTDTMFLPFQFTIFFWASSSSSRDLFFHKFHFNCTRSISLTLEAHIHTLRGSVNWRGESVKLLVMPYVHFRVTIWVENPKVRFGNKIPSIERRRSGSIFINRIFSSNWSRRFVFVSSNRKRVKEK